MPRPALLAVPLCLLLIAAFSGPGTGRIRGEGNVHYDDPTAVETVTEDYGSTDLQATAEFMTQGLLSSPIIARAGEKLRLREVVNYTDEHIDAKGITDKIRVKLLNSGKVRFLADAANLPEVHKERELTETETERLGNNLMQEADYILTRSVRSIRKQAKKFTDVYYQITMERADPQSGEIVWASEKEIRKTAQRSDFGW